MAAATASCGENMPKASRLAAPKAWATREAASAGGGARVSGPRRSDQSARSRGVGARISAGSRRPRRAGRSAGSSEAVSKRPVETSSQAAPSLLGPSLGPRARASSRLGRCGSSRLSSVRVPGVTRRMTARLRGPLPVRALGVLHLLGDGDAETAADQAGEVGLGSVDGDAAHGNGLALMLAAAGEGDIEGGGGGFGVFEEEFVEVAHAEEKEGVRVFGLELEPLGHGGGGAGGAVGQGCGGALGFGRAGLVDWMIRRHRGSVAGRMRVGLAGA